jgi:hypothetical protein
MNEDEEKEVEVERGEVHRLAMNLGWELDKFSRWKSLLEH